MKILKKISQLIQKTDFFYTSEMLRYRAQPEYRTFFGGFFSLAIIITLMITFYSKVIDTLNKVVITTTNSNQNVSQPPPYNISTKPNKKFMFGVELYGIDLNNSTRYFDIILANAQFQLGVTLNTTQYYSLEPCTPSHWDQFPQIKSQYSRLNMANWMCPPKGIDFQIYGKYTSDKVKCMQIVAMKCTNSSLDSRPCAPQTEIDLFFSTNSNLYFSIFFMNPLLNPSVKKYISYYLEDSNYIIFNNKTGVQAIFFMEQFTIKTDESILPISDINEVRGGIISQFAMKTPFERGPGVDIYCNFAFYKSGIVKNYERSFTKIDEIFSYIGGLFGTIVICLFFFNMYNGYSFQIHLSNRLYEENKEDTKTLKCYNFVNFIFEYFYELLTSINIKPKWESITTYSECRKQILKQLDILFLIKRINFIQRSLLLLFDQHQIKGLHLQQNMTFNDAKMLRKNYNEMKIFNKECKSKQSQKQLSFANQLINQNQMNNYQRDKYKLNLNLQELNNNANISNSQLQKRDKDQFAAHPVQTIKQQVGKQSQSQNNQSQSEDESGNVSDSLILLQKQAERGSSVSMRIWKGLDKTVKHKLQTYFPQSDINQKIKLPQQQKKEQLIILNSDISNTRKMKIQERSSKILKTMIYNEEINNKLQQPQQLFQSEADIKQVNWSWTNRVTDQKNQK